MEVFLHLSTALPDRFHPVDGQRGFSACVCPILQEEPAFVKA